MRKMILVDYRALPQYREDGKSFKIDSVTNSLDFVAGKFLSELEVESLLQYESWEMIIRALRKNDIVRMDRRIKERR